VSGLAPFTKHKFKLFHIGSIFWIAFTDQTKIQSAEEIDADSMGHFRSMYHKLLEKGVYMGPSGYEVGFISEALTDDDITKTIRAISESL
ncbi:MAG: glutamate-1-semialdehyde 2,1-aminomutase, partial [Bacteroidia bacterium]